MRSRFSEVTSEVSELPLLVDQPLLTIMHNTNTKLTCLSSQLNLRTTLVPGMASNKPSSVLNY